MHSSLVFSPVSTAPPSRCPANRNHLRARFPGAHGSSTCEFTFMGRKVLVCSLVLHFEGEKARLTIYIGPEESWAHVRVFNNVG